MIRGFRMDPAITKQKLKPGTVRRIAGYARPYRLALAAFLLATSLDALITVVNPLLLREVVDRGVIPRDDRVVIIAASAVAAVAVAVFDAFLAFTGKAGKVPDLDVVTQDAHLFHDTIWANLLYARPTATEAELTAAWVVGPG